MGLLDLIEKQRAADKKRDTTVVTEMSYPTGFLPLDYANGVRATSYDKYDRPMGNTDLIGLVGGTKTTIIGISGTGKSALAMDIAGSTIHQFGEMSYAQHADIEFATTMQRVIKVLKLKPSLLKKTYKIYRDKEAEIIIDQFETHCMTKLNNAKLFTYNTGVKDLYGDDIYELYPSSLLIDSFAMFKSKDIDMVTAKNGIESATNNMQAAQAAKFNKAVLGQMLAYGKKANVSIISVNHINQNVNTGFIPKASQHMYLAQDETMPGGQATIFLANNIIKLKLLNKYLSYKPETMEYGIPGFLVEAKFLKSRTNASNIPVELVFDQRTGSFSKTLTLLHYALKNEILLGTNRAYFIPGLANTKFTKKTWENAVQKDSDFLEALYNACLPSLQSMLSTDYGRGAQAEESGQQKLDFLYATIEEHERDVESYKKQGFLEFD